MAESWAAMSDISLAALRQPIVEVRLDGQPLSGVQSVKTINSAHYAADSFIVELALQGQPATADWAAWGGPNRLSEIEILYGLADPATGQTLSLQSAVIGPVDKVEVEQPVNRVVLSGRDYSALLIDTQSFESFENQLASDVATTIANRHGLTPMVTPTKMPIGQLSPRDNAYAAATVRQSEWDLLTRLARAEGYDVFVRGRSLFFQPPAGPTGAPFLLNWVPGPGPGGAARSNALHLRMSRQLRLARDLSVTVLSHNSVSGMPVAQTVTSTLGGQAAGTAASAGPQQYVFDVPGLTQAQAAARAQKLATDFGQQERVIEIEMPGDPFLTIESPIVLSGTGTGWDQAYVIDRIDRALAFARGFTMHLTVKSRSTAAAASSE